MSSFKPLPILVSFAVFMFILNLGLGGYIYYKQTSVGTGAEAKNSDQVLAELSANCKSLLNGGLAAASGRVITINPSEGLGAIDKEVTMLSGIIVKPNAKFVLRDQEKEMANGTIFDFQGNEIPSKECRQEFIELDSSKLNVVTYDSGADS